MMIEDIQVHSLANQTVEINLPLSSSYFNTIHECLKRNVKTGKIKVNSLCLTKDNEVIIIVGGIEGYVSLFISLLQTEIAIAGIMPPLSAAPNFIQQKIKEEMKKLLTPCMTF